MERFHKALVKGSGNIRPEIFEQLKELYPDGLTLADIISILEMRGIDLSEASFRSYAQNGLIPAAIRMGISGKKHGGSKGYYPIWTVKRLITIKEMLSGPSITMEMLHMPSFRCLSGVHGSIGLVKTVLDAFDKETHAEQEKGQKVSREILNLRQDIKQELRLMIRHGERAIVLMGRLAGIRFKAKMRGDSRPPKKKKPSKGRKRS